MRIYSREQNIQYRKEANYAGVLYEVPSQEGDTEPSASHHEEQAARNAGNLPGVRDEDVQNRVEVMAECW